MKRLLLILILFPTLTQAQNEPEPTRINDSPYHVIYNHLYWLQNDSFDPERSARSFPQGTADSTEKAIKLKQVLDGKGIYLDINRLPKSNEFLDSITDEYIYFPDRKENLIYVEKMDSLWYYSRTTIENLDLLHDQLYPFGTEFIVHFQDPFWQLRILGVKLWKWTGFVLLVFLAWLAFLMLNYIGLIIFRKIIKKRISLEESTEKALENLARLVALFLSVRMMLYFIPMFQLTPRLTSLLIKGLHILSIFFILMAVKSLIRVSFSYFTTIAEKTESTMDDQLLPVLEKLAIIILWVIGLFYILDSLDVNVTALLAGISIGGLALALAAQDTVKNFFGSLMIFIDKPFQIGDWIHFNDVDGTVEEVGIRSTRIRTFANSLTYVPNALLANSIIDNMGLRVFRRFNADIGITYDTPPELINEFVNGIREIIKMHPTTRKDYYEVHLNSFGNSSINVLIYMFFAAPSWTDELRARHDVLYAIIKLASYLGVRFAFPTQTIHIEEFPKASDKTTPEPKTPEEAGKSLEQAMAEISKYFNIDKTEDGKYKPIGGS